VAGRSKAYVWSQLTAEIAGSKYTQTKQSTNSRKRYKIELTNRSKDNNDSEDKS
jgi:hypothetical protein